MAESTQHKLDRIRPPRVQITYDVEIGNAIEKKELPLVVGILADLAGKPENAPAKLSERRFVDVDRDNFNDVLAAVAPRLAVQVDNAIAADGSKFNIELKFNRFDDFDPVNIVKQVSALNRLYEARQRLRDLLTKLDGNDELDQLLQEVVANTQDLKSLQGDATAAPAAAAEAPAKGKGKAEPEAPAAPEAN
ncbi:type VI secretion system protein ImpB [Silvimonas terrae]|uniref:Type VI secretion system protein ImpB n=1 Tax=Silvimonas terrae TaxID=300266 RepID=A0A840RDZ6_9NEIS|nr:type VI secretion system contractile sheath small subunit [Silvimonas terrae]MBB5190656.1 type VI secretion system protein ImpB [Silvimonas terrae]